MILSFIFLLQPVHAHTHSSRSIFSHRFQWDGRRAIEREKECDVKKNRSEE